MNNRFLGARCRKGQGCEFRVWAPSAKKVEVLISSPVNRLIEMERQERGYYHACLTGVEPGARYRFRLDGQHERPDPASHYQPEGVHLASEVVDPIFDWHDDHWFGLPLRDFIIYELHVGTFTIEGTFDAVIPRLADLKDLGITAVELMPVAQFPGDWNWGYDGVYPFAVQNTYGGPPGLKRLVDAAHQAGLAVILDVVYNHLGPEGNYLGEYGPYFTDRYRTPWGHALNFDGAGSDEVRHYFIENALYWQTEFHVDALRLDAVHAIVDNSAVTFLEDLAKATRRQSDRLNRRFHLIAESDLNNPRIILPQSMGGYGMDAQWNDDFHHSVHALLTEETHGYYKDFGGIDLFSQVLRDGFGYVNQYSPHRDRRHGRTPMWAEPTQFVVYSRNHDQVGNRAAGERLSQLIGFEKLKLAAGTVLLSPFVPLLFMGEEYGEEAPFQYFTNHGDPELAEAVRRGRREEFAAFHKVGEVPDPQDPATFRRSKLNRELSQKGSHTVLNRFYREVIALRRSLPSITYAERDSMRVIEHTEEEVVSVSYWTEEDEVLAVFCFAAKASSIRLDLPKGHWLKKLDSADLCWSGPGSETPTQLMVTGGIVLTIAPTSCVLFHGVKSL